MKSTPSRGSRPASGPSSAPIGRRGLVVGAGVAGAAAVAAHVAGGAAAQAGGAASPAANPEDGQGYRLTAHVRRYYETTRA